MRKLFILCAFFGWMGVSAQAAERVFAYYPFWVSYSQTKALADLPLARLDQLTYAFAYFDPQGQLQAGDAFADLNKPYPQADGTLLRGNYALLKSIKSQYPKLKTVLAVGGWNYSKHFSTVLADQALRRKAVQSTLQFLQQYGFDGIEIDWRYPAGGGRDGNTASPQDGAHLLHFIAELRAAQPGLIIGLTSGVQPALIAQVPWAAIMPKSDYVMLIATDFVGAWSAKTSHKSPMYMPEGHLSIDLAVNTLIKNGVPPQRLALMIPSQGVSFNGVKPSANGFGQVHRGVSMGSWDNAQTGPTGVFGQDEIAALKQGQGFVEYWDAAAQAQYLYSASRQQFISIETPRALVAKLAYVKQRGLLGVGLWEITSDASSASLLRQIEHDAYPLRALQHDVQIWWQHHPAWVEMTVGAALSLLVVIAGIAAFMLYRRRQQEQLQWHSARQIKEVLDGLPTQLAQLCVLSASAPPALAAPMGEQLHALRKTSERMAWQVAVFQPDLASRCDEQRVAILNHTAAIPTSPVPDWTPIAAFSQFTQQLSEQRSLEKMLEVTMQFLANDPRVASSSLQHIEDEEHAEAMPARAAQLSTELDDYQLRIQFNADLSESEQHYYQSVINQLQLVRRSLYELGRQPQLLSELYEIASRRDKLQFIRAEKGYSAIVAQDLRAPSYITLRLRAIRLYFDEALLIQVHRSYLVNPKKVRSAQKRGREAWSLQLDGEMIPISRQYLSRLRQAYPHWFERAEIAEAAHG